MEEKMETAGLNSEILETSIGHSWILLNTNEDIDPLVSEKIDGNSTSEKIETTEGQLKQSSFEDIQNMSNNSNNKSDAESDGISIISESEFYQIRSDDDSFTNSSDDNTADNDKRLELPESSKRIEESLKKPRRLEELSNFSNLALENNEMNQHPMTSNNISKHFKHLSYAKFINYAKLNIIWFTGTILLAFIVSCITSKTSHNSSVEKRNDRNRMINDKFQNLHIYEYCETIHESKDYTYNDVIEKCVGKIMKQIKIANKMKLAEKNYSKKQKFDCEKHYLNIHKTDIISNENYKKKVIRRRKKKHESYDNEKRILPNEVINNTKTSGNFVKNHKQNKRNAQNHEENMPYPHEDKETFDTPNKYSEKYLRNWEKKLAKQEERLMKWEAELEEREQKQYGKSDKKQLKTSEKYYSKKNKFYRYKNKIKYNKNNDDKTLKNFKFYKNGDKKKKRSHNQNGWQIKNNPNKFFQTNEPKAKNSVVNHDKLKKFKVPYSQRRNRSSDFDDNDTITGEWYMNLLQGRSDIRKKDQKARWWFDRANFRKIKRNKAYWYFQYMFSRESLRYFHKKL